MNTGFGFSFLLFIYLILLILNASEFRRDIDKINNCTDTHNQNNKDNFVKFYYYSSFSTIVASLFTTGALALENLYNKEFKCITFVLYNIFGVICGLNFCFLIIYISSDVKCNIGENSYPLIEFSFILLFINCLNSLILIAATSVFIFNVFCRYIQLKFKNSREEKISLIQNL